jgi:hypothetical protein
VRNDRYSSVNLVSVGCRSVSPYVAAAFDDMAAKVTVNSTFQERLVFLDQVRVKVISDAKARASQYAKFQSSDLAATGGFIFRTSSAATSNYSVPSTPSSDGSSGSSGIGTIIRRTSSRISGMISSLDIVTPRLRSLSGVSAFGGENSAPASVMKGSDSRASLGQLVEDNECISEKAPAMAAGNGSNGSRPRGPSNAVALEAPLTLATPSTDGTGTPVTPRKRGKTFGGRDKDKDRDRDGSDAEPSNRSKSISLHNSSTRTSTMLVSPTTNSPITGNSMDSPDVRELEELVVTLINRAFFTLNILVLLVENQWSYTGPRNRLRLRSSQSGDRL